MPYLPTERARRSVGPADEPARPLVLTRPSGSSLVVEDVCPRARQLGLRPGLSLGQAQAIVPELAVRPYEPQRDQQALVRLAQWALRFSPLVEPMPPDTLLLDITGCQLLFGGEENIARQAVAGLACYGFQARAAIADTVGAAYALAAAGGTAIQIAPAGQLSACLAPLPPAVLRIEPRVVARLDALGVRSVGDLLMLPRASLPARFGARLVLRLQQALGEAPEPVSPYRPEEVPSAALPFEAPVTDGQAVAWAVERLLAELFTQLRRRELALRRLVCVLYGERIPPRVVTIGLARASRVPEHVGKLLHQRLESVDLAPGVTGLRLVARETSRWTAGQIGLFEPCTPDDDEALGCLVDRVVGRLGYDAVVRPRLLDDHQPERAFRYVSVAEAGCAAEAGTEETYAYVPARPVCLFARPVPIRVIALVPDGPPTWFWYSGREYRVASARGPERLETAWWRGPDMRRDYFRVTAETGAQFWIFRALIEGQWFLHGVFA